MFSCTGKGRSSTLHLTDFYAALTIYYLWDMLKHCASSVHTNTIFKFIFIIIPTNYYIANHASIWCRKLGWEPIPEEDHSSSILREKLCRALVSFDDYKTHEEALQRFQAYMRDRKTTLLSADTKMVTVIVSRLFSPFRDL